jgi:hypothetical protein
MGLTGLLPRLNLRGLFGTETLDKRLLHRLRMPFLLPLKRRFLRHLNGDGDIFVPCLL